MKLANLAIGLLAGIALTSSAYGVKSGEAFPPVTIKHHDLQQSLGTKGKVTVVNFWATWCASCKVELVEFEEDFQKISQNKDFQMALVSLDKDPKQAVEWFKSNLKHSDKMLQSLYTDSDFAAAETLGVDSFPMTFVIGKDGKIQHIQKGFKEGSNSTQEILQIAANLLK